MEEAYMDENANETILDPNADINMTSRQGTIYASRNELVELLGDPHDTNGDKTTMEWFLQTPDGVASLYDYYWNAPDEWSIGGHTSAVVKHVKEFLRELREARKAVSNGNDD